ncbi:MAG: leucine-rich repeat domain-containing protein, partial [Clostridia bacterium]|nr:leucine-rich repeat domain-containing protein [Clostridia bacterium]
MKRKSVKIGKGAACLLICLALCALQAGIAAGETRTVWSYQFEIQEDNTAKIIEYRGTDTELIIPAELDGFPVTAIGDGVFQLKQKITSVVIPEGVVSIGSKAFSSCDGITKIKLPKTLKSIGNRAFSNCKGLRELVLPEGLEVLMENPFALCDNLTEVSFSGPSKRFEVRDGALINKEEARLIAFLHKTENGGYVVPGDIRIIGNSAFVECKELTAVKLPDSLEVVEESAFNRCVNLESLTLPLTLRRAENRAFANCEKLTGVAIPDALTEMPGNAFMGCSKLVIITLSPTNPRLEMKEGVLFDNEENRLICYPCASTGKEYAVPEGT